MYSWRITKYDPRFRDDRGAYKKDEWTSISDIGKRYDGKAFALAEYLSVESQYVRAIIRFMDELEVEDLSVKDLEKRQERLQFPSSLENIYPPSMIRLEESLKEDMVLGKEEVGLLARLILREKAWCRLRKRYRMFVHFGYDYYMYIGASSACTKTVEDILRDGLFVEPFESPYRK